MHTRLSIALLLLGCGGACSPPASPAPRLVVLYATCTLNKDYLSPYNATVDYTPHLASLARDGRVFMKHHTESGISGVAYAALLSGQHATRHGVFTHPRRLSDAVYLVTEAFADAGYETFFWADHPMATPEFNYGQGVPASNLFWTKRRRRKPAQERFLKATDPRLARILERLMSDPTYRAFLLTNFTVTHGPYRPDHLATFCSQYPEECESVTADDAERYAALFRQHYVGWVVAYEETRESLGLSADDTAQLVRVVELLYKANVHYLDTQLGALIERIDAAGLLDQSLIAFTADHGEVLYRENAPFKWTHGGTLAPEVLEVPLIVRGGGVQPGLYDRVTRSVDVFPTLAGLAEIEPSVDDLMGVDLSASLRGAEPPPELIAFMHTAIPPNPALAALFPGGETMWLAARKHDLVYKLISLDGGESWQLALYDWGRDRGETKDLFTPGDRSHDRVIEQLRAYGHALAAAREDAPSDGGLGRNRRDELLRTLGYIE